MKRKPKPKPDGCINCSAWRRFDDADQNPDEDIRGNCALHPPTVLGIDMVSREIMQALSITAASFKCEDHRPIVH